MWGVGQAVEEGVGGDGVDSGGGMCNGCASNTGSSGDSINVALKGAAH